MSWHTFIGLRMIRNRRRNFFFSPMYFIAILSIAFGLSATLVTLSVISGFQTVYEKAILGFNAHLILIEEGEMEESETLFPYLKNLQVTPEEAHYWRQHLFGYQWRLALSLPQDQKMEELKNKGILEFNPFIFREGLGILPDEVKGVILKGIDPHKMQKVYPLDYQSFTSLDLTEALSRSSESYPPVIIGQQLFEQFFPQGITDDRLIRLLVSKGEMKGKQIKDYTQSFEVIGTFESGLYEFDSQFIFTSLETMQSLFDMPRRVSGIEVTLDDPSKAHHLARVIEGDLSPSIQTISWDELNEALFSAMKLEKTLFFIMMLILLLIASFNVIGIIVMLIWNRQGDISILKAIGAEAKKLGQIFSLQGVYLAFLGALLGTFLSAILLYSISHFKWFELDPQIYFVTHLPVVWPKTLWIILIASALFICYITSRVAARITLKHGGFRQTFR